MNRVYPCDIIKDLLPGYIDGILSETGEDAVKEHLQECSVCWQCYEEMTEEIELMPGVGRVPEEQAAIDGFKKLHRLTRTLKLATGIVTGLLLLCFLSVLARVYVIGRPMSTAPLQITSYIYNEETGSLTLHGTVNVSGERVKRVAYKESDSEPYAMNVLVYTAETVPFLSFLPAGQEQREFEIIIPDAKGYIVYLACPEYDRREIYDWKTDHYEKLAEMEKEIYSRIPELNEEKDALSYVRGIESINGEEGICYSVTTMIGDDAYYWWFNDQMVMHGDFATLNLDIWISLEEPYHILIHDYRTGEYTEDFSIVADRKQNAKPEELLKWIG
ncbi:MAG: zf-HC2 domain-containing protein [Lachnospiraceae bacterium]|nr:zf-HC2 domain-containing protein [Lachnospiraceae bacterium]